MTKDEQLDSIISHTLQEALAAKINAVGAEAENIREAGKLMAEVLGNGNKILLCGNGGSAGDAQHIAAELMVRFKGGNERPALPAIPLMSDPSSVTACGNDYGYDRIFSRAIEGLGNTGDLLIAISTSGNSENVMQALTAADMKNMQRICLLGKDGGKMKGIADIDIIVPSEETARIQECHIMIGHILCAIIEKQLFDMD